MPTSKHILSILQPTIRVAVEYYDEAEKEQLLKLPTARQVDQLVCDGVEIPTQEFLTYYLFHKKRPGKPGWRNYQELGRKIDRALSELDDWVVFTGESIATPNDISRQVTAITEHIGESIGMSAISRIHGLSAADWETIPVHGGTGGFRTFDFMISSDGQRIVQLEAKGSSIPDNTKRSTTVSAHYQNIRKKKNSITESQSLGAYKYPADIRYGTITVVGENISAPVRCLLVDPPSDGQSLTAKRLRLLHRERFLRDWIVFLSPRSQLASALQTRLLALQQLHDPYALDGVPLLKGNGKQFDFSPQQPDGVHSNFFISKARILGSSAGGVTLTLSNGDLFFLGIREALLSLASRQRFGEILDYKTKFESVKKSLECAFTASAFEALRLSPGERAKHNPDAGGYYYVQLSGLIHCSDTGVLFGVLPLDHLEKA